MTMKSEIDFGFNQSGELISLRFDGVEFVAPDGDNSLFLIQLRDFIGNALLLDAADFSRVERCGEKLFFSNCAKLPGSRVEVTAKNGQSEIRWKIAVFPGNDAYKVEWIDFPRVRLRRFDDGKCLLPFAEGTLVEDLDNLAMGSQFRSAYAEYPMTGISSFYPGPAPMQFEAYYTGRAGLYICTEDAHHSPKSIDVRLADKDALRLLLQHFIGGEPMVGYETVIAGIHGDWQDAAERYRSWMEENDQFLPKKLSERMPPWFAASPVLLIYPVRGNGLDAGGLNPNEYYPYTNALPVIAEYRRKWNNPLMALLMHWEGTAPWAPPYVWPPYGGEAELADFITALHAEGNLLGLYGSGIGWTQQSMIDPNYSCQERFETEAVAKEICRGPHGESYSRVCNGPRSQRIGYDLCPAAAFTEKTVVGEISSAAKLEVDYLQYFDQNQGCAAPLCYATDHGHPSLPGAWQTEAMRKLLHGARQAAGKTVLGCENAAAEPYLETCQLNDLRYHLAWGYGGKPVPAYAYVFHEYVSGFSGNGVCLSDWVDTGRTPLLLQWLLAWNFTAGNLLSVVLKDSGKIHWNWALPWTAAEPEQQPLIELISNLADWRRNRAAEYLIAGRMEKTPPVQCGSLTVYRKNTTPLEVPAVLASAWSNGNKRAVLLVNCTEKPEPCRIDFGETFRGMLVSHNGEQRLEADSPLLTIPPLNVLLLETKID